MNVSRVRHWAWLALVLTCACRDAQRAAIPLARDSAGIRIVEIGDIATLPLPAWTLAEPPRLTIGGGDERPGHDLFGVRGAGVLEDGRVVIGNGVSGELRFFDAQGALAQKAGGSGEGPGEFRGMTALQVVAGDTILTYDVMSRRLTRFSSSGTVLDDAVLQPPATSSGFPEVTASLDNGNALVVPGFNRVFTRGERRDTIPFFLFDRTGNPLDSIGAWPGTEQFFGRVGDAALRTEIPFGRTLLQAAASDIVVIGDNDEYRLAVYDAAGRLRTLIRAAAPSPPVTSAELRAWKDDRLRRMGNSSRTGMWEKFLAEVPSRPTHPPFNALAVDRTGAVWVGRPEPRSTSRMIWEVFAADGNALARVRTPRLRILDIGRDYVLGLTRDEMDREVVRLFPLQRN